MLDFNGSKAAVSSHTLLIIALLAPLCWMLGLWINMKLYIQMCIKDELLPLRSRMQPGSETPFSTLFSWEVVDASK